MVRDHRLSGTHVRTRAEPVTLGPFLFGSSSNAGRLQKAVETLGSEHCFHTYVPKGQALHANTDIYGDSPVRATSSFSQSVDLVLLLLLL